MTNAEEPLLRTQQVSKQEIENRNKKIWTAKSVRNSSLRKFS